MLPRISGVFRLTKNVEVRYSQDGKPIGRLSLVASEKYRDNEDTLFLNATVFGKQAEIINQYFHKGSRIECIIKLKTETWETQEGKRSTIAGIIENFGFVDSKQDAQQDNTMQAYQQPQQQMPQNNIPHIDIDDGIPF